MKLISMKIQNFKRIRQFTLTANGQSLDIYGENATGKSTIYNAFLWLLFGKDNEGRADFEIKPTDKDGKERRHLQTLVEGEFLIGGKAVKLCRTYAEKWSKKRGEENQTMSGHETAYYIDDVPQKKMLYNQFIYVYIDEEIFKILTNPLLFNDEKQMPWKRRREMLLSLVQNVDDADLIAKNERFSEIVLRKNSVDETNKFIAAKLRKVREEIDSTQTRVDEVSRAVGGDIDIAALKAERDRLAVENAGIEARMTDVTDAARRAADHQTKLALLHGKMETRAAVLRDMANDKTALTEAKGELARAETKLHYLRENHADSTNRLRGAQREIETMLVELATKKDAYSKPYSEPTEESFICPTCGQALPAGDVEAQKQKIKAAWLAGRKKLKEECVAILTAGKQKREHEAELETTIEEAGKNIRLLEARVRALQERVAAMEAQGDIDPDLAADEEYQSLTAERRALEAVKVPTFDEQVKALRAGKAAAAQKMAVVVEQIAAYNAGQKARERVGELKSKIKTLVQEQAGLEKQKLKIEEFIMYKCGALEARLNEKFTGVKLKERLTWRLFETQVNGEIKDTCQCLIDGVPFAAANDAARVNAGLAIIEVLCATYGKTAPIFIDNAERVNDIIDIDAQVIRLIVSRDNPLRIALRDELREAM